MAILRNKVLYVLNDENVYEIFTTVKKEIFLTADTISNDIYSYGGNEYNIAIKSPVSKKVVRIYLLNNDESLKQDISEFITEWDLEFQYQQGITRTGNLTIINLNQEWNPHPLKKTVWKGSKFKIEIGIYYNDIVFWRDCGIYVCGDITVDTSNNTISFPIYDKFALLDGTIGGKRVSSFSIPKGTLIKDAIKLCLSEHKDNLGEAINVSTLPSVVDAIKTLSLPSSVDSIGRVYYITTTKTYYYWSSKNKAVIMNGNMFKIPKSSKIYRFDGKRYIELKKEVFDIKPILFPAKYLNEKTPYTITKDPNGTIGEIIIELADMISCDVYYNTTGNLVLNTGAVTNDDLSNKSVLWSYNEKYNQCTQPTYDIKFSELINQVIVAGSIANGYQYKASVVNDNPKSQMNIYMTEPNPLYIEDTNLIGDDYCLTRAKYEMIKQGRLSIQINFDSIYIPHLDCNFLFLLTNAKLGIENEKFVINTIKIKQDMTMTITASNVDEVSFE